MYFVFGGIEHNCVECFLCLTMFQGLVVGCGSDVEWLLQAQRQRKNLS